MGIFDKMFGRGASKAQEQPNGQQRFDQLRGKYQTVLNAADKLHIQFHNVHIQDDKLYIKGIAPSEDAKNQLWDQIKLVNPNHDDIAVEVSVNQSGGSQGGQSYTVKSGDTLSKISKQHYGDADEYMRIFYANRDKLNDPDKIQVGQELVIPPDDNA